MSLTVKDIIAAMDEARAHHIEPIDGKYMIQVTEYGIAYMKARMANEPDFRKMVQDHAATDPDYRRTLIECGIDL